MFMNDHSLQIHKPLFVCLLLKLTIFGGSVRSYFTDKIMNFHAINLKTAGLVRQTITVWVLLHPQCTVTIKLLDIHVLDWRLLRYRNTPRKPDIQTGNWTACIEAI